MVRPLIHFGVGRRRRRARQGKLLLALSKPLFAVLGIMQPLLAVLGIMHKVSCNEYSANLCVRTKGKHGMWQEIEGIIE